MNDPDYMQIALNEDVHNYHINMTDGLISTRDIIKTFFYALLYGSGVKNLSNVCGLTIPVMKAVMDTMNKSNPQQAFNSVALVPTMGPSVKVTF